MFENKELESVKQSKDRWEETTLQQALARSTERRAKFITTSSEPIDRLYTPLDVADMDYDRDLAMPGEFPYTRGIHATMYRGRSWTMRMFAGFGTAEETNARFKYLLAHGETGLSTAFDMPTLYGYDTDAPQAVGEFGTCGVAVSSLADMEILYDGIPVDQVTTSMTINSPAAIIWAMYIAAAEKRGISREKLGGTIQNDILKEYIAQKEFIFPPEPSMRLVVDTMEFGTREVPQWNTISISGYHIREAGSTALQELAFTLADGMEYVRWGVARGMKIDEFAPRLSFFFNAHNDFFEEIAKYRAARRIWAKWMREKMGAQNERSWLMRFHTQTAGVSLTAQQPMNNVARVAIQALAAVLGGTQSLHTDSFDEAWAVPSQDAAMLALRTQQIIANETGITNTIDPLGGSYFLEALTNKMEKQAWEYFAKVEKLGGS
jgi:methylmalonyl-CoA mutase N-terminal domain/subunit